MTEEEWLTCGDPSPMEIAVQGKGLARDRKMRLFGCACVRGVWEQLSNESLREAVLVCERFADGHATAVELSSARESAHSTYQGIGDIIADHFAIAVTALCELQASFPMGSGSAAGIAAVAAEAWADESWGHAWDRAKRAHSDLLRDVFGSPFRPVALAPGWRTDTVLSLAGRIYESRDFGAMPILADALQDAGCDDADILNHCRQPGEHVRGCWVVDLLLGKG